MTVTKPKASKLLHEVFGALEPTAKKSAVRALVDAGFAENDLGDDAIHASGRPDWLAASREREKQMVLAQCRRFGLDITGPISVHALDCAIEASWNKDVKTLEERFALKHNMKRVGLFLG